MRAVERPQLYRASTGPLVSFEVDKQLRVGFS